MKVVGLCILRLHKIVDILTTRTINWLIISLYLVKMTYFRYNIICPNMGR